MVTHETYKDVHGKWLLPDEIEPQGRQARCTLKTGEPITIGAVE